MKSETTCQIVISGVGGQGVLFVTRLLAEAAIAKGLPVYTSETHGMAQRGGTVISHLKVGPFASPLINPGRADGLIAMKAESLAQHGGYLNPAGWAAVNGPAPTENRSSPQAFFIDADHLAGEMGNPRAVNLIMLGFFLARTVSNPPGPPPFYCNLDDIGAVLQKRLSKNPQLLAASMAALGSGAK
ncbi:2-oxoacid:acceptor oxidoreductase family protein [Desulfosarcina ovata]|uniref:Indolepyruvate oxidoreductase n=2 Tax=Desulfosarcina ovata TaxID=83564 RepID=A0A5K8AHW0_9BACT|nr:2-oxoacid:acceptor oxidoreductase family protein [Desulfosarcina ovata]BBO82823.1 indolepyruvate oxidoreductase [Desulfosarcina ovata subsp. sediminis]BBO91450.1 indolepyruvate oxidoreductase [Desulfosarcina ovata subsp. ovata]